MQRDSKEVSMKKEREHRPRRRNRTREIGMMEALIGHDNDFVFLNVTGNKWKIGDRVPVYATPKYVSLADGLF